MQLLRLGSLNASFDKGATSRELFALPNLAPIDKQIWVHSPILISKTVLPTLKSGPLPGDRTSHSSRCGIAGCLSDRPQLAVAKFTAHEYRSFPLLLRPTHECSRFYPVWWSRRESGGGRQLAEGGQAARIPADQSVISPLRFWNCFPNSGIRPTCGYRRLPSIALFVSTNMNEADLSRCSVGGTDFTTP